MLQLQFTRGLQKLSQRSASDAANVLNASVEKLVASHPGFIPTTLALKGSAKHAERVKFKIGGIAPGQAEGTSFIKGWVDVVKRFIKPKHEAGFLDPRLPITR